LPKVCGTTTALSDMFWARLWSFICMLSRAYLPKSLSMRLPLWLLLLAPSEHLEVGVVHCYDLVPDAGNGAHLASLRASKAREHDLVVLIYEGYRLVPDRVGGNDLPVLEKLDLDAFDEA